MRQHELHTHEREPLHAHRSRAHVAAQKAVAVESQTPLSGYDRHEFGSERHAVLSVRRERRSRLRPGVPAHVAAVHASLDLHNVVHSVRSRRFQLLAHDALQHDTRSDHFLQAASRTKTQTRQDVGSACERSQCSRRIVVSRIAW